MRYPIGSKIRILRVPESLGLEYKETIGSTRTVLSYVTDSVGVFLFYKTENYREYTHSEVELVERKPKNKPGDLIIKRL